MKRYLFAVSVVTLLMVGLFRPAVSSSRSTPPIPKNNIETVSVPTQIRSSMGRETSLRTPTETLLRRPTADATATISPTVEPTATASSTPTPVETQPPVLATETPAPKLPLTSIQAIAPPIAQGEVGTARWEHRSHLADFINSVANNTPGVITGVFVPDIFALPVLQQPAGQPAYVSDQPDSVTQYGAPAQYGVIGLLAHNTLSGRDFSRLEVGQPVVIVYGDRQAKYYRVDHIERFQALTPTDPYSNFIDLSDPTQKIISSGDVFNQIYTTTNKVVFQTCIEANGDPSWGRLFVVADPIEPLTDGVDQ